jgi:hypothetical protein
MYFRSIQFPIYVIFLNLMTVITFDDKFCGVTAEVDMSFFHVSGKFKK